MKLSIAHFSRDQEFEADRIGIRDDRQGGLRPLRRVALPRQARPLERAARHGGAGANDKPDMMATHPSTPERIAAAVAQAKQLGAKGIGETGARAYLSAIDGLDFGDNPGAGARARHGGSCIPSSASPSARPTGFALENQSAALIGVGEAGSQALRLDSASTPAARRRWRPALASGWIDGVQTDSIETIKDADVPTAVAVAKGEQWSFRLAAVRLNGRIYRLIFAAHALTPAVDQRVSSPRSARSTASRRTRSRRRARAASIS